MRRARPMFRARACLEVPLPQVTEVAARIRGTTGRNGTFVFAKFGEITRRGTWRVSTESRAEPLLVTGETLLEFAHESKEFDPNIPRCVRRLR